MEKKATSPAPAKAAAPKKSAGGLNPVLVIPVLLVIGILSYQYICGDASHFVDGDHEKGPKSGDYFGIVYEGGPIVPLLFISTWFMHTTKFAQESVISGALCLYLLS